MAGNLSGYVKIDCALQPSTYGAAVTSEYYKMDKYSKVIFITEAGSGFTASGSFTTSVVAAYTDTGAGSQAIGVYTTGNGAPTSALVVTKAKGVLLDNASSWKDGDAIVINNLTFTCSTVAAVTTGTFSTNRYVHVEAGGANADKACNHLAALVNHGTYGCTGVTATVYGSVVATASSNNVYLFTGGRNTITVTAPNTDVTLVPCKFETISECQAADLLAYGSSSKYVGITVTPSSSPLCASVICIRSGARFADGNTGTVSDYDLEMNT